MRCVQKAEANAKEAQEEAHRNHQELLNLCLEAEARYTTAKTHLNEQRKLMDELLSQMGENQEKIAKMESDAAKARAEREAAVARFSGQRTLDGKVIMCIEMGLFFSMMSLQYDDTMMN